MSLILNLGSKPDGLEIKTNGISAPATVFLGDYEISLKDFLIAAHYVLTNTDLEPDDPRFQFIRCVRSMKQIDGYNPNRKRLKATQKAVPPTRI